MNQGAGRGSGLSSVARGATRAGSWVLPVPQQQGGRRGAMRQESAGGRWHQALGLEIAGDPSQLRP